MIQTVSHPVCSLSTLKETRKLLCAFENRKEKSFRMSELDFLFFNPLQENVVYTCMSSLKYGNVIHKMSKPSMDLHVIHPPATIKLHMLHSKRKIIELLDVHFHFNPGSLIVPSIAMVGFKSTCTNFCQSE